MEIHLLKLCVANIVYNKCDNVWYIWSINYFEVYLNLYFTEIYLDLCQVTKSENSEKEYA